MDFIAYDFSEVVASLSNGHIKGDLYITNVFVPNTGTGTQEPSRSHFFATLVFQEDGTELKNSCLISINDLCHAAAELGGFEELSHASTVLLDFLNICNYDLAGKEFILNDILEVLGNCRVVDYDLLIDGLSECWDIEDPCKFYDDHEGEIYFPLAGGKVLVLE